MAFALPTRLAAPQALTSPPTQPTSLLATAEMAFPPPTILRKPGPLDSPPNQPTSSLASASMAFPRLAGCQTLQTLISPPIQVTAPDVPAWMAFPTCLASSASPPERPHAPRHCHAQKFLQHPVNPPRLHFLSLSAHRDPHLHQSCWHQLPHYLHDHQCHPRSSRNALLIEIPPPTNLSDST